MSLADAMVVASSVPSQALLQHAEELLQHREIASALVAFDRAEADGAEPDRCCAGRWNAHMFAGNFAAAWRESDAIRAGGTHDPHRFWQGEDIAGKRVIVRCLHGLGDAVQMLRYLPLLRERCAQVVVEVPPRLLELTACFASADEVITWGDDAPAHAPAWDVQVEVMELPYLFLTVERDLPLATSYVHLPAALRQGMSLAMGASPKPRVGIVWSASEWDLTRCLPIDCVARLTGIPGVEFWNLQGGAKHEEALHEPALADVRDASLLGDGVLTLAAIIEQLDLVITVDTLAAHLAGALGKPAWVLLQHAADWRWMHARNDSPWYPTLRLWRQSTPGDWRGMVEQVCFELKQWEQVQ
jgi:hypothetical protein